MRHIRFRQGLAIVLGLLLSAVPPMNSFAPFGAGAAYAYTGTATVKAASLNVRSGAGTNFTSIGRLTSGSTVNIRGEQTGTDGNKWYQIQFTGSDGAVKTGYVSSVYIKIPINYTTDSDFEAYLNSQGFPESYKEGLRQLHAQYPNWVFRSLQTQLDWNTVIENESLPPRNLVNSGSISSWKSVANGAYNWDNSSWTGFDGSNWVAASDEIIRYYMDPRNFLDETYIFQFLSQEYNGNTQTRQGLETLVKDSFLSGTTDSTGTGGSNFSSGPGGSGTTGPGGSSRGPGAAKFPSSDDSQSGPGVVGGNSNRGGGSPSSGKSPSNSGSSGGGSVSLEGPQASVTPRQHVFVGDTVSFEAPGQSGSGTQGQAPAGGSGSQNVSAGQSPAGGSSPSGGGQSPSGGGSSPSGGPNGGSPSSGPSASTSGPASTGSAPGGSGSGFSGTASYVDIIMKAGEQSGVNPYVLAAMIMQEQGKGTSPLISGNYSGYQGYYNYFNVEAYQSGSMSAIERGLWYASQSGSYGRPWNTVEKSILGGALNYGDNYVKAGQNTFYLKKFNVQGSNLYKHQYMSNVQAAASEGAKLSQAYTSEVKNTALEFVIPVFKNMPDQPCPAPTGDGSPNNKLSGLGVDGFSLTPTFSKDTESYNLIVDTSVTTINVQASAADSSASVNGAGLVNLGAGTTDVTLTVTAQNGSTRTYVIHVAKQNGGPTSSGGTYSPGAGTSPGSSQTPGGSGGSGAGPGGSTAGPGGGSGPANSGGSGPGGSNVTIVTVSP